jgi:hypothetical protein
MTTTTASVPVLSMAAIAERFETLAAAEKWFEIQDELFDNGVKDIEPAIRLTAQTPEEKTK